MPQFVHSAPSVSSSTLVPLATAESMASTAARTTACTSPSSMPAMVLRPVMALTRNLSNSCMGHPQVLASPLEQTARVVEVVDGRRGFRLAIDCLGRAGREQFEGLRKGDGAGRARFDHLDKLDEPV